MAQDTCDKALLLKALDDEDKGTTGLSTNTKESFSSDARESHQALTKRSVLFLKTLPSTKDACGFEMPQ